MALCSCIKGVSGSLKVLTWRANAAISILVRKTLVISEQCTLSEATTVINILENEHIIKLFREH